MAIIAFNSYKEVRTKATYYLPGSCFENCSVFMPSWKDFLQFDYLSDGLKQVCQVMSSSYKKAEPREFHVRRKAMSKFQGTQNKIFWRYHHSETITWLSSFLVELLKLNEGPILKTAHLNRSTCFFLDLHGCFPNPATITTLELTSGQPRKL